MTSLRVGALPRQRQLPGWALSATLGGFMFGYELAVISGALLFLRDDFALNGFEQGALVSIVPLGAMGGGLLGGRIADRLGRRRTLILVATLFVVATVVAVTAPGYGVLLAARGLTGVAVGAASSTVPLYLSEMAPPEMRGRFVGLNQLTITAGVVAAYLVGFALSGSGSWRGMFAVGLVPAILMLAGMVRAPETPAWLEAHARGGCPDRQGGRALRLRELLRSAAAPALLIAVALAAMQQFTGINAVIPYSSTIMEQAGLTASNSLLSSVLIGLANFGAAVVSLRLVDRRGRRPLLLASAAGAGAALALLGLTLEVSLSGAGSWLPLVFLLVYITSFGIGLGPIFWVLIAEIFPPEARAAGAGVATAVNWLSSFVVGLTFVPLSDALGPGPMFWGFAAVCVLTVVFVRRYVPETKGRPSTEIAQEVSTRIAIPRPARRQ
jgi:SP family galactose:H+ symporter-like MFS transporter